MLLEKEFIQLELKDLEREIKAQKFDTKKQIKFLLGVVNFLNQNNASTDSELWSIFTFGFKIVFTLSKLASKNNIEETSQLCRHILREIDRNLFELERKGNISDEDKNIYLTQSSSKQTVPKVNKPLDIKVKKSSEILKHEGKSEKIKLGTSFILEFRSFVANSIIRCKQFFKKLKTNWKYKKKEPNNKSIVYVNFL